MNVIADRIVRKNPFLRDWSNYGIVDIFNPVATAQYQHSVTIPTKPGMMHDFRDLRFFQSDGTEIPFWNESQTSGSTSFNWIKPYSASQRKVYVFYGNRDAVSQSNGDKTFEFFDHFDAALDTTNDWYVWLTSGSYAVSGSVLSVTGGSGVAYEGIGCKQKFGTGYAFRSRVMINTDNSASNCYIFGIDDRSANGTAAGSGTDQAVFMTNTTSPYATYQNGREGSFTQATRTNYLTSYTVAEIQRNSSTSAIYRMNDSTVATLTGNVPTDACGIVFLSTNSLVVSCDWCLVRKYAATEPTCQFNQSGLRNPEYR